MTVEGDVTLVLERITDEWQRCEALGHRFDWEFLPSPEPVQFEDGDVIRVGATVWVRGGGRWGNLNGFDDNDAWAARMLQAGHAVRLVPEANGD